MIEQIILGITQGIAEWLPISSEGMLFLIKTNFFNTGTVLELFKLALFLHFGTFLAALVYFWKDVVHLFKGLFKFNRQDVETKNTIIFLIITTIISGAIGLGIMKLFYTIMDSFELTGRILTGVIAALLLITGTLLLYNRKNKGLRDAKDLRWYDSIILGIGQGLAVLPGLSRSGTTVSLLLLRKIKEETALKLSFLMSLPLVLFGNIFLNLDMFILSWANLVGLLFAFLFGILTIHVLLKFAKKVNFGWFVIVFGILMAIAIFI